MRITCGLRDGGTLLGIGVRWRGRRWAWCCRPIPLQWWADLRWSLKQRSRV